MSEHPNSEGGEPEYPLIGKGRSKKMEQRALKEGWVKLIDENAKKLVERQINDAMDPDAKPRDRRGSFSALMKAKNNHQKENPALNLNLGFNVQREMTEAERKAWVTAALNSEEDG